MPVSHEVADRLADEWNAMPVDLTASSVWGTRVVALHSGHYPHFDEPTFTLRTVQEVLHNLR